MTYDPLAEFRLRRKPDAQGKIPKAIFLHEIVHETSRFNHEKGEGKGGDSFFFSTEVNVGIFGEIMDHKDAFCFI